jgi:putative membrane protein
VTAETLLPPLNTALIGISGIALLVGLFFIKRGNITCHKRSMLTATAFAALFLIVYLIRWALLGSKPFEGEGAIRAFYFAVLLSHMPLAVGIVPLVLITLRRALRGDFQRHKRIARVTLLLWLYVVVTGWLIYWLLYGL